MDGWMHYEGHVDVFWRWIDLYGDGGMFPRYELIFSGGHRCFLEMDVLIEMDGWLLCGGVCFFRDG